MTVVTISKEFRFEAAHQLPNHQGKCAQPHGHSYRCRVFIRGEIHEAIGESDDGMVIDFADVSAVWKRWLEPVLDHQDLNESLHELVVTTAEHLAVFIFAVFDSHLDDVVAVEVYETATSCARYDRSAE